MRVGRDLNQNFAIKFNSQKAVKSRKSFKK